MAVSRACRLSASIHKQRSWLVNASNTVLNYDNLATMTSADFRPTFRRDVFTSTLVGLSHVNPLFCATDKCAADLAEIISDLHPKVIQLFPLGDGTLPATVDGTGAPATVPWFEFESDNPAPVRANAGLLAMYWTHGLPPAFAESQCRGDIALAMKGM